MPPAQLSPRPVPLGLTPSAPPPQPAKPAPTMMKMLAFASLAAGAHAGAVQLTEKNFEESIAGKGAFVKFLAPW